MRLIAITGLALLFAGCQNLRLTSSFTKQNISIDGRIDDWPSQTVQLFTDQNLAVGCQNDDNYVYFILQDPKGQLQDKAVMIWLNDQNEHTKNYGIRIPPRARNMELPIPNRRQMPMFRIPAVITPDSRENRQPIILTELSGATLKTLTTPSGQIHIEFRIPRSCLNDLLWPLELNQEFALGVELLDPKSQRPEFQSGENIKGRRAGNAKRSGGQRPGRAPRAISNSNSNTTWISVQLS